jgi:hypothetical protein
MFRTSTALFLSLYLILPSLASAQQGRVITDQSGIPRKGKEIADFVPRGWKIEARVSGDLNRDSLPDYALKLVEDKPAANGDVPNERRRVLIVLLRTGEGKLARAAVTDRLLQCTTCGGAFYGVVEAPANVAIKNGVLIVDQDHGSREVTALTYRFRYEPNAGRFALIGFDIATVDRATGVEVSESTNYLTGARITTRRSGAKAVTSKKNVATKKIYIEQVDSDEFEAAAAERLHL